CGERQTHRSWLSSCRCVAPVDCPLLRDEGRAKSRKEQGRNECGWPFIGELCNKAKSVRLRPPGASFFGLVALAECYDFRWVDGIVVDLHFNDFAALVDHVVDAASCFVLGIVETILEGNIRRHVPDLDGGIGQSLLPLGLTPQPVGGRWRTQCEHPA